MDLREAAQMALDAMLNFPDDISDDMFESIKALRAALVNEFNPDWDAMAVMVEEQQRMAKRIEELESALAQPEQEPWGYISHKAWKMPVFVEADDLQAANLPFNNPDYTPVYKAPPQREWQGLTDEEIKSAWSQLWYDLGNGKFAASDDSARHTTIMFAKEIEAKLREKNFDRPS